MNPCQPPLETGTYAPPPHAYGYPLPQQNFNNEQPYGFPYPLYGPHIDCYCENGPPCNPLHPEPYRPPSAYSQPPAPNQYAGSYGTPGYAQQGFSGPPRPLSYQIYPGPPRPLSYQNYQGPSPDQAPPPVQQAANRPRTYSQLPTKPPGSGVQKTDDDQAEKLKASRAWLDRLERYKKKAQELLEKGLLGEQEYRNLCRDLRGQETMARLAGRLIDEMANRETVAALVRRVEAVEGAVEKVAEQSRENKAKDDEKTLDALRSDVKESKQKAEDASAELAELRVDVMAGKAATEKKIEDMKAALDKDIQQTRAVTDRKLQESRLALVKHSETLMGKKTQASNLKTVFGKELSDTRASICSELQELKTAMDKSLKDTKTAIQKELHDKKAAIDKALQETKASIKKDSEAAKANTKATMVKAQADSDSAVESQIIKTFQIQLNSFRVRMKNMETEYFKATKDDFEEFKVNVQGMLKESEGKTQKLLNDLNQVQKIVDFLMREREMYEHLLDMDSAINGAFRNLIARMDSMEKTLEGQRTYANLLTGVLRKSRIDINTLREKTNSLYINFSSASPINTDTSESTSMKEAGSPVPDLDADRPASTLEEDGRPFSTPTNSPATAEKSSTTGSTGDMTIDDGGDLLSSREMKELAVEAYKCLGEDIEALEAHEAASGHNPTNLLTSNDESLTESQNSTHKTPKQRSFKNSPTTSPNSSRPPTRPSSSHSSFNGEADSQLMRGPASQASAPHEADSIASTDVLDGDPIPTDSDPRHS